MDKKDKVIDKVQKGIDADKKSLSKTNAALAKNTAKKNMHMKKIASLKRELRAIASRTRKLSKARQIGMKAFIKRQARDKLAVVGLSKCISMLQKLISGKFIQKSAEEVKQSLLAIPKGHHLEAFVELTTSLNPTKIKFVIKKLQAIKLGIKKSILADKAGEKKAVKKFNSLMKEMARVAKRKKSELSKNSKQLALTETALDDLDEKKTNLKSAIKKDTQILGKKKLSRAAAKKMWDNKIKDLTDTRKSLAMALKVVSANKKKLTKMADNAGAV